MNRTRLPFGEILMSETEPADLERALPIGYSNWSSPAILRTMASEDPSGDQSASVTSSTTGRGSSPNVIRDSMPTDRTELTWRAWVSTAYSPVRETESSIVLGGPIIFGATVVARSSNSLAVPSFRRAL